MSLFKQKLKNLLNDSYSLNQPKNIEDQFCNIILKTYRKIKKDNSRQSIILSSYKKNSSKLQKSKIAHNNRFYSDKERNSLNKKRGISFKTAENMVQTFSLLNNDSRSCSNNPFYINMSRYLNNNSKSKEKIKKHVDFFKIENSISKNHICNRPKTVFKIIKNNKNINRNPTFYKLKPTYSKKLASFMNNKNNKLIFEENKDNTKKNNYNFSETIKKNQNIIKFNNCSFSRNYIKKYFSKSGNYFKSPPIFALFDPSFLPPPPRVLFDALERKKRGRRGCL